MENILIRRYYLFIIVITLILAFNTYLLVRNYHGSQNPSQHDEELLQRFKDREKVLNDSLVVLTGKYKSLLCERDNLENKKNDLQVLFVKENQRINKLTINEAAAELKTYIDKEP